MHLPKGKVKFGIIGSGAITEESYLPAAKMTPNVVISHLVDQDIERVRDVAQRFQISHFVRDYREIFGKVDAVVVATPPSSHSKISIECMNNGLHVLCEKPLALTVAQAKDMVEACQRTNTHLGVGMVRRLSWSAGMLKKLIGSGLLGKIRRFDMEEGWEFNWPLRTAHLFQNENSRGVITDTGSHLFDLLIWILGSTRAEVTTCKDDSLGGIEANALIDMAVEGSSYKATGRIELSFTRRLRNTMKFFGERGCLEAETVGADELFFFPPGQNDEPLALRPKNRKQNKKNEEFSMQLYNFAASILNGTRKYTPAEEAIMSMYLIETCYHLREPFIQPWEMTHLEPLFAERKNAK